MVMDKKVLKIKNIKNKYNKIKIMKNIMIKKQV